MHDRRGWVIILSEICYLFICSEQQILRRYLEHAALHAGATPQLGVLASTNTREKELGTSLKHGCSRSALNLSLKTTMRVGIQTGKPRTGKLPGIHTAVVVKCVLTLYLLTPRSRSLGQFFGLNEMIWPRLMTDDLSL